MKNNGENINRGRQPIKYCGGSDNMGAEPKYKIAQPSCRCTHKINNTPASEEMVEILEREV